jgi:hypothetical protein
MIGVPLAVLALGALSAAAPTAPVPETDIPAIVTQPPRGTQTGAAPPLVNNATTGISTHGPYSGKPTTTGAEQGPTTLSNSVPSNPNPTATYYNPNGKLTQPQPIPYMPGGNSTHHCHSYPLSVVIRTD